MTKVLKNISGDRTIWAIIAVLAIFSFLPVYSASTNLVGVVGKGTTLGYLLKHAMLLVFGFVIIYATHKIPFRYFSGLSVLLIPVVLVLLAYTLYEGKTISGVNASRWIDIPFVGIGFQTSTLASVVVMMFTARYLAKNREKKIYFKDSIIQLWIPVGIVLALILPANFSTTAIIFSMVLLIAFLGGYPLKFIGAILGSGILIFTLFILTAKAFPDAFKNSRINTWAARIENFSNPDEDANYQAEKAKLAIASGEIQGKGPGKSVQKNFLPQSSSDFIYAIIVEEFGSAGGFMLMILYLGLLFRIVIVATKTDSIFGTLLVLGVGIPIVFQALINMAVAVGLFPVTGQPLPLISTGGTSIWMTCFALGVVLSVSADREAKIATNKKKNDDNPLSVLHEAIG
ncbi:FtsW/RodA/SpoVE family cell cycle protein [Aureibaculum sp. 2210JD6-5]|uniref:FtsW/RodA/SpoVE family cell cycle protein n=1 Tax=Aureibaculum sp. 2210JD6-5 TaxID=3103957 RepID=UPI002AAD1484|nr:FtsW/RodA/SpoVE family cell cycle protein [Aureibaculum sp. 2210JD6-5]MDY7394525.1 FtsW/RodA/SpoVE family cell cycle protein [Aureibaculum sp. 2210JD6-5]